MKNFTTFISEAPEDLSEAPGKYKKRGDKELYQWGDINQALMQTGTRAPQILDVLTKLSKKEVGIHEEIEEVVAQTFEELEEAKAPKIKKMVIKGNEISGLKSGLTSYSAKPVENKGRLAFRVVDEFGGFETLDLKAFAKKFG
tara:strand:+ start:6744 stop:7172 length:429 start_codon:yes stop_codon:yes gene_type:complete